MTRAFDGPGDGSWSVHDSLVSVYVIVSVINTSLGVLFGYYLWLVVCASACYCSGGCYLMAVAGRGDK